MNKDDKKRRANKDSLSHLDFDNIHVSSSLDCTGLIPSGPVSEDELDSYGELYDTGAGADPEKEEN